MGSYCTTALQCTIVMNSTVQCRNSKCQCGAGFEATEDGMGCRIPGSSASSSTSVVQLLLLVVVHVALKYTT